MSKAFFVYFLISANVCHLSLACFSSSGDSNLAVGQVKFRPSTNTYVRCVGPGDTINCRDTLCKIEEVHRPQLQTFGSLAECMSASHFVACYNPSQTLCVPDTPGCNRTYQVQWPNDFTYFSSEVECQSSLPDAVDVWIRCNNRGMPICRFEKCHDGERFLSTGPGFYADHDSCQSHLFWARTCYVPKNVEGLAPKHHFYYELIATFDTQDGRCENIHDQVVMLDYSSAATRDLAAEATTSLYSDKLVLTHVRCQVDSEPVCRPIGITVEGHHEEHFVCGHGETLLKGTMRESWPNLESCNAERFWGLVCYRPTRVHPFYEIYVNATQFPICSPGDLALGQVSADSYAHLLEKANNMYTRGRVLSHQRCGLPQGDDTYLPICRPLLASDNNCSVNEDRLGLTPINRWNTYGDCLEERFWGIGCYTANMDEEPYYNYHTVWDSPIAISCPTNSIQLGPLNTSFSSEMLNKRLEVYYTATTQLTHRRCDVNGVPVCRPDVDQASVDFCGQRERQIGRTDNTTFGSLAICLGQRYWRLACYRAISGQSDDKSFYEIYGVDALNGGCDAGDLTLRYYSADTMEHLPTVNEMQNDYLVAIRTTIRCEVWDEGQNKFIPVCRPSFGTPNLCPHMERRLSSTSTSTWNSLTSCNLMRYWGIGCYMPNKNQADDFYKHEIVWDNHLVFDCPLNSRRTTPTANYSSDPVTLANFIAPFYDLDTQLSHWRCSVDVAPGDIRAVCRPDIDGGSVDGCAVRERRIGATVWGSLELCREQIYWTILCYHATTTAPYYELIRKVVDKPNVTCDTGDLQIGLFSANQLESEDFFTEEKANEYYENLFFTHNRCLNKLVNEPICRPQFGFSTALTGNNCPNNEFRLADAEVSIWNSVSHCNSQRFWGIACYEANMDAEPFYVIKPVEDNIYGFVCPPNSVRIGELLFDSDRQQLHDRLSQLYTASLKLLHRRCDVNGVPVCRPSINTVDFCGEGEVNVVQTTPLTWPTLDACSAQRYWAIGCYTSSATAPYYKIYAVTHNNGLTCAETDVQLVSYGARTQEEAIDYVLNWYSLRTRPISHIRCALPGTTTPVCRPRYPTLNTCPEDEERILAIGTGGWNSLDACEEHLHWAFACYVATSTYPYYEIAVYKDWVSSSAATCPVMSSVRLIVNIQSTSSGFLFGPNQAQLETALRAYYNESVQMDHFRCKTADGNVVCRPALDGSVGDGCALNEIRLGATPGDTLGQCNAAKYWARICYIPKQLEGDFYDITFCFDHQCSSCSSNQVQINIVPASNMSLTQAEAESYYTPTTPITHVKCRDNNGVPYCRPNSTCADGETRVGTTTWVNLAQCQAQLWVALACYTVEEDAPFYSVYNVTVAGGSCATGDQLLGTFTASDKSAAEFLASEHYSRTRIIPHERCNFRGIPVCRPTYSTSTNCPNDEENISFGTSTYNSLDACENQLHRGFGCYAATTVPPDYFNITIYRDITTGASATCPPNAARISPMLFDSDFSRLTNRIYSHYNLTVQFDHIRCDVGNDAVCRPVLTNPASDGDQCGHGETRITATLNATWGTFGLCNKQRYWARSCYDPLYEPEDPSFEFNIVPDYVETFCPSNQYQVMLHSGPSDNNTAFEAEAQAFYPSAAIVHWRCGGTDGYPYCRPGAQCFVNETRLNATGVTAAYGSFNLCQNQRWWARVCYNPHYNGSFGDDYELYEFYDSYPNPVCAGSDLSLMWASSAAEDVVAGSYYGGSTAMTHWRCKDETNPYPYCRPLQCFPTESRLSGTTTWTSLSACLAQRFTARVCYTPLSIEAEPYVLTIRYDHEFSSCLTNETQLAILTGATDSFVTEAMANAIYNNVSVLQNHVRCQANGAAFCRPITCPALETRIGSVVYPTKALCEAVRFAAIACVNDAIVNSAINYNYTCVMDTQGCSYRNAATYTGATRSEAEAKCYSESAFPPAYERCQQNVGSDWFCRVSSTASCGSGYTKVLSNVALSRCLDNSTMYALCIDYGIKVNPIEGGVAWQCRNNTNFDCNGGEVRVATQFSSVSTCEAYQAFSSWHRCEETTGEVTCRPNAYTVECGSGTLVGTSYSSVSECLDGMYCSCDDSSCQQYSHVEGRCLCPSTANRDSSEYGIFWQDNTCAA